MSRSRLFLDLTAIASIGSAVALTLFTLVTISHMRVRQVTQAKLLVLLLALTLATLFSVAHDHAGGGAGHDAHPRRTARARSGAFEQDQPGGVVWIPEGKTFG